MSKGVADFHLMIDEYSAEELSMEYNERKKSKTG